MDIKILKLVAVLFNFSLLIGCTKDFKETNTNPATYSATDFDPNYLLSSAQLQSVGVAGETIRGNFIYSSTLIQGMSSVLDFWVGDKYLLNEQYTGANFEAAYPNQIKNIVDLIQLTKDKPEFKNLYQISRITKALIFQKITDLYGDIPYFDAGRGYYDNKYFPSYDPQQKIYEDLLKEVDEAVSALDVDADKPSGDLFYNGDIEKWKKFGNTLLLRIAMRLTKVDPSTAQTYVNKVQGKTMQSNEDNAFIQHEASGPITENKNTRTLNGDEGPDFYYIKWS
jgi:hypothetical protein